MKLLFSDCCHAESAGTHIEWESSRTAWKGVCPCCHVHTLFRVGEPTENHPTSEEFAKKVWDKATAHLPASSGPETPECELCLNTGFYGDNGPGVMSNDEYQYCECHYGLAQQLMRAIGGAEGNGKLVCLITDYSDAKVSHAMHRTVDKLTQRDAEIAQLKEEHAILWRDRNDEVAKNVDLEAKMKQLRAALDLAKGALLEVRDLCQVYGLSFESQSYNATRISRDALAAVGRVS